jgi:hypothetical protein
MVVSLSQLIEATAPRQKGAGHSRTANFPTTKNSTNTSAGVPPVLGNTIACGPQ